tara:strand:+ start:2176 stop:2796 length:621 start_codon:yes stop_codon:yes gene_type:complete
MQDVIVFDDIIPPVYQNWLIDCIKNPDLKWMIKDNAISDLFEDDPRNGYCNFHYLYEVEQGELSPLCNAFMPLALQFRDKLKAESLLRMRVNHVPAWCSNIIQLPHVDSYVKNSWNVVYYIDNSNGDTIIYNERTQDPQQYVELAKQDKFTEMTRVSPKKGRAVAFKGDLFHSSTTPVGTWRPVVNINLAEQPPTANDIIYNPNKK